MQKRREKVSNKIEKKIQRINIGWMRGHFGLLCILLLAVFISPSSAVSTNIVSNPGFESGTTNWVFYTNGAGSFLNDASGAGSPHAAHIKISQPGTNVQLYQNNLALEPNTVYKLDFKAYSNTGHDIGVSLLKHGSPYTNYGISNKVMNLGTTWGTYSIQFTTTGFSGTVSDARLTFLLTAYDAAADQYYFDDITLTKVSSVSSPTPTPAPTSPPASNKQLVLLDVYHTHSTDVVKIPLLREATNGNTVTISGQGFSKFNFAPGVAAGSLVSPTNFAAGKLYQRIQVLTKPSTNTVRYQICLFQDQVTTGQDACSTNSLLSFSKPGTYYANQSMTSMYHYGNIDWTRGLLVAMTVVRDYNGNPVDNYYADFRGKWYGSPDLSLYYPMKVRYTAIIVPPGGGQPVWP